MKTPIPDTIKTWLSSYWEAFLHVAGGLLVLLTLSEIWASPGPLNDKIIHSYALFSFLLLFYANTLWLIPAFLKQKKWMGYGGILAGTFIVVLFVGMLIYLRFHDQNSEDMGIVLGLMIMGIFVSLIYTFTRDWVKNLGFIEKLTSEKLAVELAFLKSQVDPHFLFNTLNTLYALALEEKAVKTADAITKLGSLMRYNLHDSQSEYVYLSREIDFIEKYIALQRLRIPERCRIEWAVVSETDTWKDAKITPMLLIPFIENAFKHGISLTDDTFIHIQFEIGVEMLVLNVRNSVVAGSVKPESSGIGLQNVMSRLALLYPEKHTLTLDPQKGIHVTRLEIKLPQ